MSVSISSRPHSVPTQPLDLPPNLVGDCDPCSNPDHSPSPLQTELCKHFHPVLDAVQLIQLGARSGLVCQLTGLKKRLVHRLYQQLPGARSTQGQTPFTGAWYQASDLRLLHTSIVWQLHRQLRHSSHRPAQALIEVYGIYRRLVKEPLLDLNRVAYVAQLMAIGHWEERRCTACQSLYVTPFESLDNRCPYCRLSQRYHCRQCGTALPPQPRGRQRQSCPACQTSSKPPNKASSLS